MVTAIRVRSAVSTKSPSVGHLASAPSPRGSPVGRNAGAFSASAILFVRSIPFLSFIEPIFA